MEREQACVQARVRAPVQQAPVCFQERVRVHPQFQLRVRVRVRVPVRVWTRLPSRVRGAMVHSEGGPAPV